MGCMVGWRLTDERMAVFPASEAPTNNTVFPVDLDFLRTSTVITFEKPGLTLPAEDDRGEADQNARVRSKAASANDT